MLNVILDEEVEKYLVEILLKEGITSSELIKRLLYDHWQTLEPRKTFLERRGGYPEYLLQGYPNLSDRDVRKQAIARYLQQRFEHREEGNG